MTYYAGLERITHHGSIPNFGYETAEVADVPPDETSAVCLKFGGHPDFVADVWG